MGDVLAGFQTVCEFETDSVLIRFTRGNRGTPRLFQVLGERRIPLEALESVSLSPGKRGTVVLRADTAAYLTKHLSPHTLRYFKRRRLTSLGLPGGIPVQLAFIPRNATVRRVARRARSLKRATLG